MWSCIAVNKNKRIPQLFNIVVMKSGIGPRTVGSLIPDSYQNHNVDTLPYITINLFEYIV